MSGNTFDGRSTSYGIYVKTIDGGQVQIADDNIFIGTIYMVFASMNGTTMYFNNSVGLLNTLIYGTGVANALFKNSKVIAGNDTGMAASLDISFPGAKVEGLPIRGWTAATSDWSTSLSAPAPSRGASSPSPKHLSRTRCPSKRTKFSWHRPS